MNTTLNRPYNIFFQYLDTLLDQTTIYIYKNIHHSASSSRTWNVELYRSIVSLYCLRLNTHAMMVHFTTVYLTSWLPYFLVWIPGSKLHLAQVLVCVLLSSQNENKPVTWPSESFIINSFLDCWKRKWKLIWQRQNQPLIFWYCKKREYLSIFTFIHTHNVQF